MSTAAIQVATTHGPETVTATTTRHLAVHRSLGSDPDLWVLTHRPSGLRMAIFNQKQEAVAAAKTLERDYGADLRTLRNIPFATVKPKHTGIRATAAKRLRAALATLGADL